MQGVSEKIGINFWTIKPAIKSLRKEPYTVSNEGVIIAQPSYEINDGFLSLGFREPVMRNNQPEDRNFFIISTQEGCILHDDKIFQNSQRAR